MLESHAIAQQIAIKVRLHQKMGLFQGVLEDKTGSTVVQTDDNGVYSIKVSKGEALVFFYWLYRTGEVVLLNTLTYLADGKAFM